MSEQNIVQVLQQDLTYIDGVLNVGLGAALARGDVNRGQVNETSMVFARVIEGCKTLAQDNVRLTKAAAEDAKLKERLAQLEAELVNLRLQARGKAAPEVEQPIEQKSGKKGKLKQLKAPELLAAKEA